MHTVLMLTDTPAQMLPARSQMAFTLASHIILVPLGVALPLITLIMHGYGLRRGDETALLLARRWSAVMAVQFAIGVVTGTVLSFEFGLLWPGMMGRWGDVFGIGFGVEAWAFFLEAVLIAVYLYGWRRLPARTHFLLGLPLPFAALLGAFGIILLLAREGFESDEISDLAGLNQRSPLYAGIMAVCMFSLAGVPPLVGFYAKLLVLQSLVASGQALYIGMAVFAVIASLIGAFYYLRVVKVMYFDSPITATTVSAPADVRAVLSLNGALVLILGILPGGLMSLCADAVIKTLAT